MLILAFLRSVFRCGGGGLGLGFRVWGLGFSGLMVPKPKTLNPKKKPLNPKPGFRTVLLGIRLAPGPQDWPPGDPRHEPPGSRD